MCLVRFLAGLSRLLFIFIIRKTVCSPLICPDPLFKQGRVLLSMKTRSNTFHVTYAYQARLRRPLFL